MVHLHHRWECHPLAWECLPPAWVVRNPVWECPNQVWVEHHHLLNHQLVCMDLHLLASSNQQCKVLINNQSLLNSKCNLANPLYPLPQHQNPRQQHPLNQLPHQQHQRHLQLLHQLLRLLMVRMGMQWLRLLLQLNNTSSIIRFVDNLVFS